MEDQAAEARFARKVESALAAGRRVQELRPSRENSLAITELEVALFRAERDEAAKRTGVSA